MINNRIRGLFIGVLFFTIITVFYLIIAVDFNEQTEKININQWFYEEEYWASEHDISLTREYQIKVNVTKFKNRDEGLKEYLTFLSSLWDLPLLNKKSNNLLREVTVYDPLPCGSHKQQIRKRVHFDPFNSSDSKKENFTTIDVKWSTSSNFTKIYSLPFSPRSDFKPVSFQKLEYGK